MTDTTNNAGLSSGVVIRTKTWSWRAIGYFSVVHILGLVGIQYAITLAPAETIYMAIGIFFLYHLSTRIGAHSWAAHTTFKTYKVVGYILVILFSGVVQGPMLWWSSKHKHHHARENLKGEDPHTPLDGWFYSHMGWVLTKEGMEPSPEQFARHLTRKQYRPVLWQAQHYYTLAVIMGFGVPTLLGCLWGDLLGGFLVGGFTRLVLQYNCTWVVNSLCHGGKKGAAINIWLLAILTVGESFHKNHHECPGSACIGKKWWQPDLGWYVIWLMHKSGLIWNLKTPNLRPAEV